MINKVLLLHSFLLIFNMQLNLHLLLLLIIRALQIICEHFCGRKEYRGYCKELSQNYKEDATDSGNGIGLGNDVATEAPLLCDAGVF